MTATARQSDGDWLTVDERPYAVGAACASRGKDAECRGRIEALLKSAKSGDMDCLLLECWEEFSYFFVCPCRSIDDAAFLEGKRPAEPTG